MKTCTIFGIFQRLLEEGDYSRRRKCVEKRYKAHYSCHHNGNERRYEAFNSIYWCVVTAVYLGWSFFTWERYCS